MSEDSGNKRAPDGHVYVCGACGKVSRWRYGFDSANGKNDASSGWDESCAMNCGLVPESAIVEPSDWRYPQRVRRVENTAAEMKTIRFAFITLAVLVGACVRAPYYGGPTGQGHTSPIPPGWQGCGSDYQCSNGCCCPTPWPASWLGTGGSECEACVSGACQQP